MGITTAIEQFGGDETHNPVIPGAFDAIMIVGVVVVLLGFVTVVGLIVYRSTRLLRRGQNPITLQEDLMTQAMRSQTLAPRRSTEERLVELEDLHARGLISDDEHRAARMDLLRS